MRGAMSMGLAAVLLQVTAAVAAALGEPETTILAPHAAVVQPTGAPVTLSGIATDDMAVVSVKVTVQDATTLKYLRRDGTWGTSQAHELALTPAAGALVAWQLTFTPPRGGAYYIRATARDQRGVKDPTSARLTMKVGGATATPTRTRTALPPTATRVPATATRPPATATAPPATATRPPATATAVPPTPAAATPTPGGTTAPMAAFRIDEPSGPAPHVVQFTDLSTGTYTTWRWEFGDGGSSSARDPIHSYLAPGTYSVRLTVSGPAGAATASRSAAISVAPTAAVPGNAFSEFVAYCPFSHRLRDDPIVFPGQHGASHLHSFFGSTAADADSTVDDLLAGGTTCDPLADRSAYWVPTLLDDGLPAEPEQATFYYFVGVAQRTAIRPFPLGLRMLAGNPKRSGPSDGPSHYKWSCRGADVSSTADIVTCPAGHELELLLNFPECWNGTDLDSPDHKSHMAYSAGGVCPPTHPVPLPRLQFKLRYPSQGGPLVRIAAGSGDTAHLGGAGWTAHGDFFNAWEPAAQRARVENCLHKSGVKCGPDGLP